VRRDGKWIVGTGPGQPKKKLDGEGEKEFGAVAPIKSAEELTKEKTEWFFKVADAGASKIQVLFDVGR
jgi:hypothetical protein